ncbi:exotoxin beta-grasp domain-containing protein [Staphylococcus lutrae]|uniref:Staphylococcal/Streptococcal toxin beta-grasp domain-containing protein n=1 Tax=Staphylococcus lutrae TaxID=155085 RepID=A0AAC9RSE7_9STAP|nr:hypothetical protein [Staphylococcus lutrae]ARJ50831.1 hypothetical protein B5P37_05600 [Staphylococcus lutrae]PNZ36813.1 enterotoxin [Staphylococcus lutrae]
MKIKQLFLSGITVAALFSIGLQQLDSQSSGNTAVAAETKATNPNVKSLFERYSKPNINNLKEENNHWKHTSATSNNEQVSLFVEGFHKDGNKLTRKGVEVTLPKGEITLKELDHIVRHTVVNFGLYQSDQASKGLITVFRSDEDRYTFELQKPLQQHRENVKIKTEDLAIASFYFEN